MRLEIQQKKKKKLNMEETKLCLKLKDWQAHLLLMFLSNFYIYCFYFYFKWSIWVTVHIIRDL